MKKPEIFFRPIGQSGPLSFYWYPGPYGDAVECKKGKGVAWLSPSGELLGVEFDDVDQEADHQKLETPDGSIVEVTVKKGNIKVKTQFTEPV
ncbi:MAG: hypothetical protein FVQ77_11620 [Cytophagales bacterium]|nr:hypothetical protein [Cytophagales bacterium]